MIKFSATVSFLLSLCYYSFTILQLELVCLRVKNLRVKNHSLTQNGTWNQLSTLEQLANFRHQIIPT